MNVLSLTDLLAIAALMLAPGIGLAWRFLAGPIAPYRRRIEQFAAAERAYQVLSSLGSGYEARRDLRQAEIGLLGRVAFNRQVRRNPRPVYLALGAWITLLLGVMLAYERGPIVAWVEIALLSVGTVLGAVAGHGIRRLMLAARPGTLRAYRDLCRARRRAIEPPPNYPGPAKLRRPRIVRRGSVQAPAARPKLLAAGARVAR